MPQYLGLVSVVVRDYDEAIAFYVGKRGIDAVASAHSTTLESTLVGQAPVGGGTGALGREGFAFIPARLRRRSYAYSRRNGRSSFEFALGPAVPFGIGACVRALAVVSSDQERRSTSHAGLSDTR